jgi:hypothetical protein
MAKVAVTVEFDYLPREDRERLVEYIGRAAKVAIGPTVEQATIVRVDSYRDRPTA